ncbi:MAG: LPS O-antigen length regulator [Gammaproteobacteria bacterium]|nr:LPS O-antigen length regulator [Gammaproteobacteria bacterium]|tara:strand:+ start:939 stop:1901 length:963 start_codon:yes stop_codon:yes gene_type:complete
MNRHALSQENTSYDDEIDLKELFSVLWKAKILIIVTTSFFALSSVLYALSLTNFYKSEVILNVAGESNALRSLSGMGSLASMAGITLPSSGEDKSAIAIKTIQSRAFLKHLITFENVLPSIMASKSYDFESKKIQFDPKIYNENNGEWVRKPGKNQQSKPSYLEAFCCDDNTYLNQVSIFRDKKTNLITISVEHISPIFAKEFLELIINEANELLRNRDLQESSAAIAFLNTEIPKASLITMKDAINMLLQSQLQKQMLAKVNKEYFLKVIEPPFIPEVKSKPTRALICIYGTLLGGILAMLWVLMRHYISGSLKSDLNA